MKFKNAALVMAVLLFSACAYGHSMAAEQLAIDAVSDDVATSKTAISELRAMGRLASTLCL